MKVQEIPALCSRHVVPLGKYSSVSLRQNFLVFRTGGFFPHVGTCVRSLCVRKSWFTIVLKREQAKKEGKCYSKLVAYNLSKTRNKTTYKNGLYQHQQQLLCFKERYLLQNICSLVQELFTRTDSFKVSSDNCRSLESVKKAKIKKEKWKEAARVTEQPLQKVHI